MVKSKSLSNLLLSRAFSRLLCALWTLFTAALCDKTKWFIIISQGGSGSGSTYSGKPVRTLSSQHFNLLFLVNKKVVVAWEIWGWFGLKRTFCTTVSSTFLLNNLKPCCGLSYKNFVDHRKKLCWKPLPGNTSINLFVCLFSAITLCRRQSSGKNFSSW